jgi:hypothetical protein
MIKEYMDIPGQTKFDNLNPIIEIAAAIKSYSVKKPKVLEIGCAWGRSTWAILDAFKDCEYHVLDWWGYVEQRQINQIKNHKIYPYLVENKIDIYNHKDVWQFNMKHHKHFDSIHTINSMSSLQYINTGLENEFDFVFFDGSHEYDVVCKELEYFNASLVMYGDDYHPRELGVMKSVHDFYYKHVKNNSLTHTYLYGSASKAFWCIWDMKKLGPMYL